MRPRSQLQLGAALVAIGALMVWLSRPARSRRRLFDERDLFNG